MMLIHQSNSSFLLLALLSIISVCFPHNQNSPVKAQYYTLNVIQFNNPRSRLKKGGKSHDDLSQYASHIVYRNPV